MRCKKCNARLGTHDLWCVNCGMQSPVVKTDLAAMKSLKNSRKQLTGKISAMVPAMGFSIILGAIPIAMLIWIFNNYINNDVSTIIHLLLNLSLKSVLISIFAPMLLIPFNAISNHQEYHLSFAELRHALRSYPKYLLFCLLNALLLMFFYLICFGFPGFASDPILRLVWIVLINYWAAIVLPAPVIMERREVNPWKAIKLSYQHFADVRWNIYLLALVLAILNIAAFVLAVFPMLFTLPLSVFAIRDYIIKLEEYELLDYRI
ncbi:MAG: hypothetical protein PWP64_444 [Candidatus Cloacimonadota bacterium]|nr:hypothetical protein [Candidatus Cloacimonadota bacterium]